MGNIFSGCIGRRKFTRNDNINTTINNSNIGDSSNNGDIISNNSSNSKSLDLARTIAKETESTKPKDSPTKTLSGTPPDSPIVNSATKDMAKLLLRQASEGKLKITEEAKDLLTDINGDNHKNTVISKKENNTSNDTLNVSPRQTTGNLDGSKGKDYVISREDDKKLDTIEKSKEIKQYPKEIQKESGQDTKIYEESAHLTTQTCKNNYLQLFSRGSIEAIIAPASTAERNRTDEVKATTQLLGGRGELPDNLKRTTLQRLGETDLSNLRNELVEAVNCYKSSAVRKIDDHQLENLIKVIGGQSNVDNSVVGVLADHKALKGLLDAIIRKIVEKKLRSQIHDYPAKWKLLDQNLDFKKRLGQRLRRPFELRNLIEEMSKSILSNALKTSHNSIVDHNIENNPTYLDGTPRRAIDREPVKWFIDQDSVRDEAIARVPVPLAHSWIEIGIRECRGELTDFDKQHWTRLQDAQWSAVQLGYEFRTNPENENTEKYANYYQHCVHECVQDKTYSFDFISVGCEAILAVGEGKSKEACNIKKAFLVHIQQLQRYKGWAIESGCREEFQTLHKLFTKYMDTYNQAVGAHKLETSSGEEQIFDVYKSPKLAEELYRMNTKNVNAIHSTFNALEILFNGNTDKRDQYIGMTQQDFNQIVKDTKKPFHDLKENSRDKGKIGQTLREIVKVSHEMSYIHEQVELVNEFVNLQKQFESDLDTIQEILSKVSKQGPKTEQNAIIDIDTGAFDNNIENIKYNIIERFRNKQNYLERPILLKKLEESMIKEIYPMKERLIAFNNEH